MLPQLGIINSKSLSLQSTSVPPWVRGNAYVAPNTYDRAPALGTIESFDCRNTGLPGMGTKRNASDAADAGDELPPCFVQPKFLYDNKFFPFLKKGEVFKKPPPTFSLRGNWPANPNTHP
jgi:hypothetical protein